MVSTSIEVRVEVVVVDTVLVIVEDASGRYEVVVMVRVAVDVLVDAGAVNVVVVAAFTVLVEGTIDSITCKHCTFDGYRAFDPRVDGLLRATTGSAKPRRLLGLLSPAVGLGLGYVKPEGVGTVEVGVAAVDIV